MIKVENILLAAARQTIIDSLVVAEHECDIEIDDQCPAVAGDKYIAVSADGLSIGDMKSPEAFDATFGFRIAAYQRVSAIPRDRRRSIYSNLLLDINSRLDAIARLFHFNADFTCAVNVTLAAGGTEGKFTTPMKLVRIDPKPRTVSVVDYAAKSTGQGDPEIAIVRGMSFGQARYSGYR